MPSLPTLLATHPALHAACLGALGAASADLHVWLGFKSWSDFKSFNFGTASLRWAIGFVTGGAAALGWSAI
jgi:hypothetical protein